MAEDNTFVLAVLDREIRSPIVAARAEHVVMGYLMRSNILEGQTFQ